MAKYELIEGIPENLEELKKRAKNQSNWRGRLQAIEEIKVWKSQKTKDVLWARINDPVFAVKEAATNALKILGEDVFLGKKKRGNPVPNLNKTLRKVQNQLPSGYSVEDFKNKFKLIYPKDYDICEGDKLNQFDKWLNNLISNLPKNK